ncbi:NAD(P)/FAD-dependent oxidoreductase [Spirochaeta cellobiosiphila]|uniref:NAD(P)/FAD-dependent oxidoreductase n=1 Tax=Spirochaeta cellobiosiphila TaxID=504483 RepID=UPI00040EB2EE|nr:FAD-binding oxidoreductase [Spirochaeta cellobiosiphila]
MKTKADILIIGSGVIGNSAAYYLAKKGHSVIVLEKNKVIGDGGSSRNGGGVRQSGRDKRELPLAMYGAQNLWPHLSEELDMDVEYYQEGNLRLGKTEAHLETLGKLTSNAQSLGLDVNMISGEEARSINPYLSEEVIGASWCPTDGHANPLLTTLGYYRRARQLGVQFVTDHAVQSIRKIKGRAKQVITDKGNFEGDRVILAAGYESRFIAETVGLDIPMNKLLLETLVTEAQPPMFYQMLGTAAADFYGHQTTHGSFVFGGTTGFEHLTRSKGLEDTSTSSYATSSTCRGILSYLPALTKTKVIRAWAGWIDYSGDGVPVISPVDEVPGLILACGFTGHGFGISPTVGLLLSQITVDEDPVLDLSALKYDRFKAKS